MIELESRVLTNCEQDHDDPLVQLVKSFSVQPGAQWRLLTTHYPKKGDTPWDRQLLHRLNLFLETARITFTHEGVQKLVKRLKKKRKSAVLNLELGDVATPLLLDVRRR